MLQRCYRDIKKQLQFGKSIDNKEKKIDTCTIKNEG